jgi:hypothetical protein
MSINKANPYSFLGEEITPDLEVKVWCIGAGRAAYALNDPAVSRRWNPGELKILTFHELYQLSNAPGGKFLLTNRLQIRDNKVREALQLPLDPEYLYTEEDARRLVKTGTKEQVLDALEFGPTGLASMIKHFAILEVDSLDKMEFFNTLFRMNIKNIREANSDQPKETTNTPKRRAAAPKAAVESTSESKPKRKAEALKPSEPKNQEPSEE